ncbi:hypothetical protein WA577_002028, partial [Blastocystis sp. JDR]
MTEEQLCEIAHDCLLGLSYLHERGIMHGDVRPVNLFLTEDGVLKLGYYGLTTQAECYSINKMNCDGIRSFAPEVFRGGYEMKSDLWSFGIALIEMMGIAPYSRYEHDDLPTKNGYLRLPFNYTDIESSELVDFLQNCFEERVCKRWSVNELLNRIFVKERVEGKNEVLSPLVKILKQQERCEWILKKDVKDSYLVLQKNGLCWYHEGLVEKFPSIVVELCLNGVIEVDIASHTLIRVNGEEVKGIEHAKVLDLSDDGERWEGDVKNNQPYGWGVLYDSESRRAYEGFRIGEVNVCYGRSYYPDVQKVEYEGEICEGKRWGRGIQYDRNGKTVFDGEWINDEHLSKRVVLNEENQFGFGSNMNNGGNNFGGNQANGGFGNNNGGGFGANNNMGGNNGFGNNNGFGANNSNGNFGFGGNQNKGGFGLGGNNNSGGFGNSGFGGNNNGGGFGNNSGFGANNQNKGGFGFGNNNNGGGFGSNNGGFGGNNNGGFGGNNNGGFGNNTGGFGGNNGGGFGNNNGGFGANNQNKGGFGLGGNNNNGGGFGNTGFGANNNQNKGGFGFGNNNGGGFGANNNNGGFGGNNNGFGGNNGGFGNNGGGFGANNQNKGGFGFGGNNNGGFGANNGGGFGNNGGGFGNSGFGANNNQNKGGFGFGANNNNGGFGNTGFGANNNQNKGGFGFGANNNTGFGANNNNGGFGGKRWGRGIQYDRNGKTVFDGEWINDEQLNKRVVLNEENQFLHNHIEELIVENNSCNGPEWAALDLGFIPSLRLLQVGDECFANVKEVKLIGLN